MFALEEAAQLRPYFHAHDVAVGMATDDDAGEVEEVMGGGQAVPLQVGPVLRVDLHEGHAGILIRPWVWRPGADTGPATTRRPPALPPVSATSCSGGPVDRCVAGTDRSP